MEYVDALMLLGLVALLVVAGYAASLAVGIAREPLPALPFTSGGKPGEHAWSRFHARWYLASMVFLAFDVEMLFMYPWAAVLPMLAGGAVVEMFGFLAIVMSGVLYAAREGAFRWS